MLIVIVGFNTDVRHRGRRYHVQTEDSGEKRPHVFTHLFADGGRIVKTTKTSYSKHVNAPNLEERVRSLMKSQHKAMVIALRDGEFDDVIEFDSFGNSAALMLRTDHAWHAVRPINCPEGKMRRVFIVVCNPDNLFWKVRDRVIGKTIQRF